jgi:valyl-tRNA synthetase
MSKSLGNGVDPMDVIEKYGADALRFFLTTGSSPGNDLRFYWEKVESTWNFANKIWNASRFALMNMDGMQYDEIDLSGKKSLADKWILTRLNETSENITRLIDAYEFGEVGRLLYNFIWDDFCDWYIEMAKLPLYGEDEEAKKTTRSVLAFVLDQTLRLLHPFMPFITEEIWQHLPHEGESITVASWPVKRDDLHFPEAANEFALVTEVIRSVRNIRSEMNVAPSKPIELQIKPKNKEILKALDTNRSYLIRFCNPSELLISDEISAPEKSMSTVLTGLEMYLPLEGLLNIEEEVKRLEKEAEKYAKEVERVQKKLSNEGFMKKAPEKVISEERAKESDYQEKYDNVQARIKELQS